MCVASCVREQPVAELSHGLIGERLEGNRIVLIEDQAGHLVLFIGDQRCFEKAVEGYIGQNPLRGDPLRIALGGKAGQGVPAAGGRSLGK